MHHFTLHVGACMPESFPKVRNSLHILNNVSEQTRIKHLFVIPVFHSQGILSIKKIEHAILHL